MTELINKIEQRLDDLSFIDGDLFNQFCCDYYNADDEPIVELFTPELLQEIEELIEDLTDKKTESLDYFEHSLNSFNSFNQE